MNKKKLFWFSLTLGVLTLGIGTGIFLLWWIGRAWFALNLVTLEGYGFLWILISIPLALTGLVTTTIVMSANNGKQLIRASIPLILLLVNIPAVYIILQLESKISQRVYFKITNRSGEHFNKVKLTSESFTSELGTLPINKSIVDFYLPTYTSTEHRSVPEIEELTLELSTETETHRLKMPYAMKGWCDRLILTDSLTLNSTGSTVR